MRLFIEAVLDDASLDAVWSAGQPLREDAAFDDALRQVRREAMHLTLRFLGEQDESRLDDLRRALSQLEGGGPLKLRLDTLGAFGGRRPRVVWAGFAQDDGWRQLRELRQRLDDALAAVSIEPERGAYRPHVTLARVRRRADASQLAELRRRLRESPPLPVEASVRGVALVQSTLCTDGPRYRRLARAPL